MTTMSVRLLKNDSGIKTMQKSNLQGLNNQ